MVMPLTGLSLLAPLHLSQVGLGPRAELRTSTTVPCRVPLAALVISTIDFTLPVSSSMVFQRPSGVLFWAKAASGRASRSRMKSLVRMVSLRRVLDDRLYRIRPRMAGPGREIG